MPCIDRGELKLRFDWSWPSGEQVTLAVGRSLGQASAVRLDYTSLTKSAL